MGVRARMYETVTSDDALGSREFALRKAVMDMDTNMDPDMDGARRRDTTIAAPFDGRAHLERLTRWWTALNEHDQALAAHWVHEQVIAALDDMAQRGHAVLLGEAYARQLLGATGHAWAVRVYGRDGYGRRLRSAGARVNGDSLRYLRSILIGEGWYHDRAALYHLLATCALARHDTVAAMTELQHAFDTWNDAETATRYGYELFALAAQLTTLTERHGDLPDALHYAGLAYLMENRELMHESGVAQDTTERRFAELYARVRGTEQGGAVRYLDSLYTHAFVRYRGAGLDGGTKAIRGNGHTAVLAIIGTPACAGCSLDPFILQAILDRFGQREIVVYSDIYDIPFLVPGTSDTVGFGVVVSNIFAEKQMKCGIRIDGLCKTDRSHPVEDHSPRGYYDYIESIMDTLLKRPRQARWAMSATREIPGHVTVRVRVDSVAARAHPVSDHLKVQILLVEDSLRFDAANHVRIWRMVPRAIAGDSAAGFGFPIAASGRGTIATTFDLVQVNHALKEKNHRALMRHPLYSGQEISEHFRAPDVMTVDPAHLGVIAMIVDDTTGEVIETRYQRVTNDGARGVRAAETSNEGQP